MALAIKNFPSGRVTNYKKFRKNIRSGDLLFCSGSGWFSKMIQNTTDSIWSHVAFVMRLDSIDRVMVLESVEPQGVRTVPLSKYLTDYDNKGNPYFGGVVLARHEDFHRKATEENLQKFGQFAVNLFGYPYDRDEIGKIAARIVASYLPFSRKDKKDLKADREYICSEYVWECYQSVGIPVPHDRRGFVSPADFAKLKKVSLQAILRKKKKSRMTHSRFCQGGRCRK